MFRILAFLILALVPVFASAEMNPKPDDMISLALTSEEWVTTKTARVVVQVNAAVSSANAGSTRDAMLKAVKELASDGDWRITSFNRSPSETGLENWYAQFEARLPEKALGGLNEKAKNASKPGMQLSIAQIDFTPTLDENEAARASLRKTLMAKISEELKAVNAAFPGREFRVSEISFGAVMAMRMAYSQAAMKQMRGNAEAAPMADSLMAESGGGVQTAQKLSLTATITFAALAPVQPAPAPAK